MADAAARKFVQEQLEKAGVQPTDDALFDYAMVTVGLLAEMNTKLHERVAALRDENKRLKKSRRIDSRRATKRAIS